MGEDRFDIMHRPFFYPEEMVEHLIKQHNSVVSTSDEVIVIGDVCYQQKPDWLRHVQLFHGKKTLIRGNHDRVIDDADFSQYFQEIIKDGEGLELDIEGIPCYLTHYPSQGRKDRFNLVGHIHGAWRYQLNMFNVGVDANHFLPVRADTIPFHFRAISEFYDGDVWAAYNEINSGFVGKRGKSTTYFPSTE